MENVVFDRRFHELVDEYDLWLASEGFGFAEGPVMLPEGYILFSDIGNDAILQYNPPFWLSTIRSHSGGANGNTLDLQGRLITCEGSLKRLTRTEPDGSLTVLADSYDGRPLNAPNDVVVRSDGSIYFTDPIFMGDREDMLAPSLQAQEHTSVFMVSPNGELARLTTEPGKPNGLAFSPDESVLYVVDSADNSVIAFDVAEDGSIASGRVWLSMEHELEGLGDGMKVDQEGNGYVTGPGGIWVASADGTPLGIIRVPQITSNLAFYGFDSRLLFITAPTAVYVARIKVPGISVTDRVQGGRSHVNRARP